MRPEVKYGKETWENIQRIRLTYKIKNVFESTSLSKPTNQKDIKINMYSVSQIRTVSFGYRKRLEISDKGAISGGTLK